MSVPYLLFVCLFPINVFEGWGLGLFLFSFLSVFSGIFIHFVTNEEVLVPQKNHILILYIAAFPKIVSGILFKEVKKKRYKQSPTDIVKTTSTLIVLCVFACHSRESMYDCAVQQAPQLGPVHSVKNTLDQKAQNKKHYTLMQDIYTNMQLNTVHMESLTTFLGWYNVIYNEVMKL